MKRLLLIIPGILFFLYSQSQINTERYYQDSNKAGFIFNNSLGFNFSRGNTNDLELIENFRVDYKGSSRDYLLIIEYEFKSKEKSKTSNNGFIHLRAIQKLPNQDFLLAEAYSQFQFDQFILLSSRYLAGGGLRLNPLASIDTSNHPAKNLKAFLGTGFFYELEHYDVENNPTKHTVRWSSYLSLIYAPAKHLSLNIVNYIQPAINHFENYRYTLNLNMSTLITNKLFYDIQLSFIHRSIPVGGKKPDDLEIKNTFRIKF